MRLAIALLLAGTALTHLAGTALAQKIDVSKLGPQVGEQIPAFRLTDQFGNVQTPESILGPKGAMLVFVRSADW